MQITFQTYFYPSELFLKKKIGKPSANSAFSFLTLYLKTKTRNPRKVLQNFPYSSSRCVTRGAGGGWGEGRGLLCPFLKIGKKYPNLGTKCPDCGHLWVKFLIQKTIFKSFQAKNRDFSPVGPSFLVFVDECLSKCLNSKKKTLP